MATNYYQAPNPNLERNKLNDLNEAIRYLCGKLGKQGLEWSDNCLVFGSAERFARVSLDSPSTVGQWTTLFVQIFANDQKVTHYNIRFDVQENAPDKSAWSNPQSTYRGGHVWSDRGQVEWYIWRPLNTKTAAQLEKILKFHGIDLGGTK